MEGIWVLDFDQPPAIEIALKTAIPYVLFGNLFPIPIFLSQGINRVVLITHTLFIMFLLKNLILYILKFQKEGSISLVYTPIIDYNWCMIHSLLFYNKVKELCKEKSPKITIKELVFQANLAKNSRIMEGVADIEKLRDSLYDSYYQRRDEGYLPPLDLAVEMAEILETSVEYLVKGVNRDDFRQKMNLLIKCRKLEKEIHEFNEKLGNELDLKDVE